MGRFKVVAGAVGGAVADGRAVAGGEVGVAAAGTWVEVATRAAIVLATAVLDGRAGAVAEGPTGTGAVGVAGHVARAVGRALVNRTVCAVAVGGAGAVADATGGRGTAVAVGTGGALPIVARAVAATGAIGATDGTGLTDTTGAVGATDGTGLVVGTAVRVGEGANAVALVVGGTGDAVGGASVGATMAGVVLRGATTPATEVRVAVGRAVTVAERAVAEGVALAPMAIGRDGLFVPAGVEMAL